MRIRRAWWVLAVMASTSARAQLLVPEPDLPAGEAKRWQREMTSIDAALVARRYERAAAAAQKLLDEMLAKIAHGVGIGPLFGRAVLERALAHAGLGREREAAWDLAMARTLDPGLVDVSLAPFGAAADRLKAATAAEAAQLGEISNCTGADCGAWLPPKELVAPEPVFPKGSAERCTTGPLRVSLVIGADGLLRLPAIDELGDASLAFAALDALAKYRYQPATLDGKAVAIHCGLTINFRLPRCD